MSAAVGTPVRRFRPSRWIKVLSGGSTVLFMAVAYVLYHIQGWSWLTIGACGLIPVGIAGFVDSLTSRVELGDETLVVVQNLRRREYPRSMFVKATWGKGVPVALQCESGQWVRLPSVGTSGQAVVNTLRAWIKK